MQSLVTLEKAERESRTEIVDRELGSSRLDYHACVELIQRAHSKSYVTLATRQRP